MDLKRSNPGVDIMAVTPDESVVWRVSKPRSGPRCKFGSGPRTKSGLGPRGTRRGPRSCESEPRAIQRVTWLNVRVFAFPLRSSVTGLASEDCMKSNK